MAKDSLVAQGDMRSFMRRFHLTPEASPPKRESKVYTALIEDDSFVVGHHLPDGFMEVMSWKDGNVRRVWADMQRHAFCTYCEHDLHLELFGSSDAFLAAVEQAQAFYAVH